MFINKQYSPGKDNVSNAKNARQRWSWPTSILPLIEILHSLIEPPMTSLGRIWWIEPPLLPLGWIWDCKYIHEKIMVQAVFHRSNNTVKLVCLPIRRFPCVPKKNKIPASTKLLPSSYRVLNWSRCSSPTPWPPGKDEWRTTALRSRWGELAPDAENKYHSRYYPPPITSWKCNTVKIYWTIEGNMVKSSKHILFTKQKRKKVSQV